MFDYIIFASFDEIKNYISNITSNSTFPYVDWMAYLGIVGIAGASILGFIPISQLYNYMRRRRNVREVKPNGTFLIPPTESKLDDLIREIEDFITKWREGSGLTTSYRRFIETRSMYRIGKR
jgi:hypothetical protein